MKRFDTRGRTGSKGSNSASRGDSKPSDYFGTMSRPARFFRTLVAFASVSAMASTLSAQAGPVRRGDASRPRGYGDISFAVSQPIGAFNDFIGAGYGVTGGFVWNLDRDRVFGIRAEGGFVQYGSETTGACLVNCRINVDVNTSNDIVFGGIGPQITVPAGWVRPYINATAGVSYFFTHSSISGDDAADNDVFDTTNHDDAVFALTGGGGFLIPISMRRTPVLFDLGATFHRNGQATYLRKGSIVDRPDGSIVINPIRSEANFVTFRIGVSIGIPTR